MKIKVKAFPVWVKYGEKERVQCVQHPDTGKWWFRHTVTSPYLKYGKMNLGYKFSPWECPELQPEEPYKGMKKLHNSKYAMLPAYDPFEGISTKDDGFWKDHT